MTAAVGIVLAAAAAAWVLAPLRGLARPFALTRGAPADGALRAPAAGDGAIKPPEASGTPGRTGWDAGGRR